jgi:DsbC/DsbD-like thiol-disulfide interchange protein
MDVRPCRPSRRWQGSHALVAVVAAFVASTSAGAAPPREVGLELPAEVEAPPPKPVRAELLADVEAIQPGRPFLLGVRLHVQPGWHVYWKDPGDAGLATSVEFALPEGFRAGELRWPVPVTFRQPGDVVGSGYENAVLLAAEITPPAKLPPGRAVELRAEVAWLGCKAICVPGEQSVRLTLSTAAAARPANTEIFRRWRQRLPVAAADKEAPADAAVAGRIPPGETSGQFTIRLQWKKPPPRVEWYPAGGQAVRVENVSIRTEGARTRIAFRASALTGARDVPRALEVVVVGRGAKGVSRGLVLRVPLRPSRRADDDAPKPSPRTPLPAPGRQRERSPT